MCKGHECKKIAAALHRAHDVVGLLKTDVVTAANKLFELLHRRPGDRHVHLDAGTGKQPVCFRHIKRPRTGALGNDCQAYGLSGHAAAPSFRAHSSRRLHGPGPIAYRCSKAPVMARFFMKCVV